MSREFRMERIRLTLDSAEYWGLAELSEQELRPLADQVRHLVREELGRRGLIDVKPGRRAPLHWGPNHG
jgi:hypothetical protein